MTARLSNIYFIILCICYFIDFTNNFIIITFIQYHSLLCIGNLFLCNLIKWLRDYIYKRIYA